jgi:hypothetical protein
MVVSTMQAEEYVQAILATDGKHSPMPDYDLDFLDRMNASLIYQGAMW